MNPHQSMRLQFTGSEIRTHLNYLSCSIWISIINPHIPYFQWFLKSSKMCASIWSSFLHTKPLMALLMLFMQVFRIASDLQPGLEGHISPDPVDAEGYMVLLVYKNGSLTQEVSAIDGKMGFYCDDRETLPPSLPGSSIDLRPVPLHASSCWKIWHAFSSTTNYSNWGSIS